MPEYAIDQLGKVIGNLKDLTILVLGISYRSNVKESAFSGVFDLVEEIEKRGARAVVSDPLYSDAEIEHLKLHPYLGDSSNVDAVVLHTNHRNFSDINFLSFSKCKAIYDGRNLFPYSKFIANTKFITLGNKQIGV
jgi:UDP-N-acetyl-D-mannosaminuronate dehydrogenase